MRKLVTYYFSVNENSPANERLDNMKPYLTESLFQSLSLKFQDDTVTISTTWGETTNNMMIAIHTLYDSTQSKWLADSLNSADQVSFESL